MQTSPRNKLAYWGLILALAVFTGVNSLLLICQCGEDHLAFASSCDGDACRIHHTSMGMHQAVSCCASPDQQSRKTSSEPHKECRNTPYVFDMSSAPSISFDAAQMRHMQPMLALLPDMSASASPPDLPVREDKDNWLEKNDPSPLYSLSVLRL